MRRARDDTTSSETAEDELHVEVAGLDGAPARERPQARPRGAWRTVGIITALLAVVFIALGGPLAVAALATQTWQAIANRIAPPGRLNALPVHLNASPWTPIHFPARAATTHGFTFVPAASTSRVAYACWLGPTTSEGVSSALTLALTQDGGSSWSALPLPVTEATACGLVVDVSQPQYALLTTNAPATESCGMPQLYVTTSSGASWQSVTLPPPLNMACAPAFFLAGGHLYAWAQEGRYASADGPPGSPLMVSTDAGATWSNAFPSMSASAFPIVLGAHADGSLLVEVEVQGAFDVGPPVAPALWCRGGSTGPWQLLANTPETSPNLVIPNDPAGSGCTWTPIYAFAFLVSPDTGLASITAIAVLRGTSWEGLPKLPVAGASGLQPLGNVGRVLGVGPAGTLLVDVPDAANNSAGSGTPQRILWGWEPSSGQWLRDYPDEPGITQLEGISWDHTSGGAPTAVLWVYGINLGLPPTTGIFATTLGADPTAPSG